uniref:Retrovirus-related Pol polyprotein from transposon TNT 1-94 n=1 Tax=Tanacetum cinerariifolium TaxID=118510 RepID=A0A699ISS6_TANCI|nr:retrovirus-related Pol polyprotein from transposon TNT 1-94 [Tanacetum cinerariifolium]
MTEAKFGIEKFDRIGDFGLWRVKMCTLLIQHGCEAALEVLREVTGETNAARVWSKLETLYMTKLLANKLYLKKKLYTFYMPAERKISEHIDEFNKIILDLANIEVNFKDEDLALLLLTSLPASCKHFVDTLLYEQEALTLEDVMATLNLKEIKERSKAKGGDGDGLYVRERTDRRDSCQSKGKSRLKSQGGRLKCYIFQFKDHLKKTVLRMIARSQQVTSIKMINQALVVRFMMVLRVLLSDNRECKIRGIGKTFKKEGYSVKLQLGKIKVINGSTVVLFGTRRDNCVYSLDGHAVAGELNASVKEKDSLAQVWHKRLGHISEAGLQVLEKQKKTPMEMWLGHPSDYGMLRTFGCVAYSYVKQGTWSSMKVSCTKTVKDSGAGTDKSVEELQVDVELQGLSNRTPEEDHTYQEDGNDENARDQETVRHLISQIVTEEDTHEPLIYQEAVACEDNDMLIACKSKAKIVSTKTLLKKEFNMKELGEAKKILGMDIIRDRSRKILRVSQSGTKHINVRYHFIKEVLEAKTFKVLKVGTEHNVSDGLTKVVPGHKLQHCLELLSVGIG